MYNFIVYNIDIFYAYKIAIYLNNTKKSAFPHVIIQIHPNKFTAKHISVKIQLAKVSQKYFHYCFLLSTFMEKKQKVTGTELSVLTHIFPD